MNLEEELKRAVGIEQPTWDKAASQSQLSIIRGDLTNVGQIVDRIILEMRILSLRAADIIDAEEFRRIMKMLASPDQENHTVAQELIANLTKQL